MILVTGATGNVGSKLVPMLLDAGQPVRVFVRDERKVAHLGGRVERAVGDLNAPETIAHAMQGVDRLFLVTGGTAQVANLVAAARDAGVGHVVKQSTVEADRSLGPGRWHREQERMIESSGLPWTFLRPTLMMVNVVAWWSATVKSQGRVYFPRAGRVPPIDPLDVAAVACAVLADPRPHQRRTYELTGPELLTVGEMVRVLETVIGRRIRYVRVPTFVAALAMRRLGMSRELVRGLVETLRAWRGNEYARVSDAVERVTGRPPRRFETWCREHRDAFARGSAPRVA